MDKWIILVLDTHGHTSGHELSGEDARERAYSIVKLYEKQGSICRIFEGNCVRRMTQWLRNP